jgi:TolB-like protein
MSSIIEGYNYDIFISYRQKDNKHDGWVTEFVDNLKGELESTFKEDISIYFDENPHDGLLETHDVDASLKDKLKCLVFIPILSRTYCDPKSFAWEHEFKAFVEQASQDQFGLKIKLPSGNVASRILPIRIYDLDTNDIKLCESILGGVLRSVDFIYKSAGVNRPLRANEDHPHDNLNKTYYRDQINKVANSIKEIITAIVQHIPQKEEVPKEVFKPVSVPRKSNKTKIIIASVIVLALIILGYFLVPTHSKPKEQLEKSIAVLPFRNDSASDSTTYFINGLMEEILNNLQKIKDFRVLSRNSVEQFRNNTTKSTPEIAKKLGVNYIVEGSGQKYGNKFVLRVQLIVADNEKHLWGKSYDREIRETSDIISTQSEIAQSIAAELNAIITPEEKQLINKIPTTNLTAYDFYQQGREEYAKAALQKAEDLYHKSLKYDSTFAPAYSGLAMVYWDKHYSQEYFSENFMDSVLILANIALSHDYHLSEPYTLKGRYYSEIGKPEQAIEEFDKAIKLNPNDWMAYWEKGDFYYSTDLVNNINCLQKAASINRGPDLPGLLLDIGGAYFNAGFPEKAKQYYQDKLKLDGDSSSYYDCLENDECWLANFNKSIEFAEKGYAIDSTDVGILEMLGMDYAWLGQYKESLKYYKKWLEILKTKGELSINDMHRIGYVYWQNGYKKEAEYYFNEQIKYCNRTNELKRLQGQYLYTYYDLAGVYAFRGEKDKAYKNLRIFNKIQRIPLWMATLIKTDPLFNSIRNEPEFQQITRDVEAKYQAEHERVRKWLEEQGML